MNIETVNETYEISEEIDRLETIAKQVSFYNSTCILPFGILFNIFAFFIFAKKSLNKKSTNLGFIYRVLILSNTFALLNQLAFDILDFIDLDIFAISNFNCKFLNQWLVVILQLPSSIQVLVALDIYMGVCSHHHHLHRKFSSSNYRHFYTLIFIAALFILLLAFNSIYYFGFYLAEQNLAINFNNSVSLVYNSTICTALNAVDVSSDGINILLRAVVPFLSIMWLNVATIRGLLSSKRRIAGTNSKTNISSGILKGQKEVAHFANATICMNLIFMMTYLPWIMSFVAYHTFHFIADLHMTVPLAKAEIVINVFDALACFNNYSAFFISIAFNDLFRREVVGVIRGRGRVKLSGAIVTSETCHRSKRANDLSNHINKRANDLSVHRFY